MGKTVKIKYDSNTFETRIMVGERIFDTSRINGKEISDWAYPFIVKNIRWNGIYDELKSFVGETEKFQIQFDGAEKDLDVLRTALKDTSVRVAGMNNKVVILYKREPLTTKITVNGKVFDTSKLQNRYIDEWVSPFQFRDVKWDGIFQELERFIGTDLYTIQFVGEQDDMKELMKTCPENVDIFFKPPVAEPQSNNSVAHDATKARGNLRQNFSEKNISQIAENAIGKMSQKVSDEEINQNLQSIPIKNEFIRKNAMAICAVLSIIFAIFPFIKAVTETSSEYTDAISAGITLNGFTALFGSNGSLVTAILFLGPILIIIMNYIPQLKPYRKIIATIIPALCILFEILVFFVLKITITAGTDSVSSMAAEIGVDQETSVTPQIGFFLLLLSYILTAVVGYITYYGMKLPVKK